MIYSLDSFKEDCIACPPEYIISKWVMEKLPFIFNDNYENYINAKLLISKLLKIDSCSIIFVGSSSTGFSLNPKKEFRTFNAASDIDIAIISYHYFNIAWHALINADIRDMVPSVVNAINEHRQRLIYYGTIATDRILGILPFGGEWLQAMNELSNVSEFADRKINFRLYKDHESLRAYHVNNINKNIFNTFGVEPESKLL